MEMLHFILDKNDCYRAGVPMTPRGVMIHSTGANNTNISRYVPLANNTNHWNRPGVAKCVHAFIGRDTLGNVNCCQTLPWNMKGWHAGSVKGGISANNTHIGFECCEDDLQNETYFRQVYDKAVELTAYLCTEFGLNPLEDGVVISHHEGHLRKRASNHADIDHWFKVYGVTMDDFRRDVANKMKEGSEPKLEGYSKWAINEKVEERIIASGISDGTRPQDPATREEMFAMMLRFEDRLTKMFGKE